MKPVPPYLRVKFGEEVWHDEPYDQRPADFFDRDPSKEQALAILRSPQTRRAVWLIGERRAGKTSMLKLLLEKCRKEGLVSIEIPWQSIHSSDDFYKEFLVRLDDAIRSDNNLIVGPIVSFWDALRQRQKEIGQRTLVVGIDELDSILLDQIDDNARKEIVGCILRLVTQEPNMKVILASAKPPNKIEQFKASPLVSKSEEIFVQPFPDADVEALIRSFDISLSSEITDIKNISGGWPYYVKAILYHLLQLPAGDSERLEQARLAAVRSIAQTCEHLYRHHWDENERRILWLLTNKKQIQSEEFDQLDDDSLRAILRTALRELTQRRYLLDENGRYCFGIGLIADWLNGWTRREIEEERLEIPSLLKKLSDPWIEESREQVVQITKEDLRHRGF